MRDDQENLVLQYLDGEMTPAEADAFERRLAAEPELAALMRQHSMLGQALTALGQVGHDASAMDRQRQAVMAQLERRQLLEGWRVAAARPRRLRPVLSAAMALAAMVLLAVVAYPILKNLRGGPGIDVTGGPVALVGPTVELSVLPAAPKSEEVSLTVQRPPLRSGPMAVALLSPPPVVELPEVPRGTVIVSTGPLQPRVDGFWPDLDVIEW